MLVVINDTDTMPLPNGIMLQRVFDYVSKNIKKSWYCEFQVHYFPGKIALIEWKKIPVIEVAVIEDLVLIPTKTYIDR